jgi:hypothetical protein
MLSFQKCPDEHWDPLNLPWVIRGSFSESMKWPGHAADPSPLSSAKVMHTWRNTSTSLCAFMVLCLIKH